MGEPTTYTLTTPVTLGSDTITTLTFAVSARAFKGFALPTRENGTVMFEPYELAAVGIRMAGQPPQVLDRLTVQDMAAIAGIVMDFLGAGLGTGSAVSPS